MRIENWGEVEYNAAVDRQLSLVEEVQSGAEDTLVFCTHSPVVTVGRATKDYDIFSWEGAIAETSRGGRATYHGPNQAVIYPIVNLDKEGGSLKKRDLHGYLRKLERALIMTLKEYGIDAEMRSDYTEDEHGEELQLTGVWVGEQKIASLGVAVKRWVTYHGAAINIDYDPKAFTGINPCGFRTSTMVSLEELLDHKVDRQEFQQIFANCFQLTSL